MLHYFCFFVIYLHVSYKTMDPTRMYTTHMLTTYDNNNDRNNAWKLNMKMKITYTK